MHCKLGKEMEKVLSRWIQMRKRFSGNARAR